MASSLDELKANGYCDERGAVVGASVVSAPNWRSKFRIALLCVKGNILSVYETDLKSDIGERIAAIEISRMENFVLKANFWTKLLSFDYQGKHYEFTNFPAHRLLKRVLEEERNSKPL